VEHRKGWQVGHEKFDHRKSMISHIGNIHVLGIESELKVFKYVGDFINIRDWIKLICKCIKCSHNFGRNSIPFPTGSKQEWYFHEEIKN
jgi:hypothetical protein